MQSEQFGKSRERRGDPVLGSMIRARRQELNLSQRALGEAVDRDRSHIANVESGRDWPGTKMLAGMATKLGLSLDKLLKSKPPGTEGTYSLTVTEAEADLVFASRGYSEDEINGLTKILLRGNSIPKQS